MLDSLPALTRRMRLSVNVWTPELNILHETEAAHNIDFKQYLVHHDPDDLMEESKNAWRCIGKLSHDSISQVMVNLLFAVVHRLFSSKLMWVIKCL